MANPIEAVNFVAGGSFAERIYSEPFWHALWFGSLSMPVLLVIISYRQFPLAKGYFSGLFIVSLSPILFTALMSVMDLYHLIEHEDLTPDYVVQRLRGFLFTAVFSFAWSALGVAVYSGVYLFSRRGHKP